MTDKPWEKNEYFWIAMINNKHISYLKKKVYK